MKGFLFLISILVFGGGAPASAAPPVCNPTTEGTIVYNVDHKVMQYCDGTNWISMRGSAVTSFDTLSCADGEIVEWNASSSQWVCKIDAEGVTSESDPTVPTNLKDGVAWGEVSGIPAGFADGTDDGLTSESDPQVNATTSGKWCRGTGSQVTCDQDAPSGDNLGNHTATATLAMGANAMTSSAGTIRDGNGGWVRTYGNTGWYNGTHGGGWHMSDTTWIRSYGGKWIYTDTGIRADGDGVRTNQICNTGGGNCVAQSALSGGGAPAGTWCGMRIIRCSTGGSLSYPSSVDSWVSSFACNGQTITGSCTGTLSNVPVANCPSGYASQVLYGVSGGSTNTNVMTCRKT